MFGLVTGILMMMMMMLTMMVILMITMILMIIIIITMITMMIMLTLLADPYLWHSLSHESAEGNPQNTHQMRMTFCESTLRINTEHTEYTW